MCDSPKYPKDEEIKIEWRRLQIAIVVLSVITIWPIFCYVHLQKDIASKFLTVAGLNIDIIGVVVASLKTPFYGAFHDGGKIEVKRLNTERKYFQIGMGFIALGFFLQALGTLL